MNNENDELSIRPVDNEDTTILSKSQVIKFFIRHRKSYLILRSFFFLLLLFLSKVFINYRQFDQYIPQSTRTSAHLSIYLSFFLSSSIGSSIKKKKKRNILLPLFKILLIFYVNHMSFVLSFCRYLIIIKTRFLAYRLIKRIHRLIL